MNPPIEEPAATCVTGELTRRILDDLQVSVVFTDAELRIVDQSPGLRDHVPESEHALVGQPLTGLFPELVGAEADLEAVAQGLSPRFDLPMINRVEPAGVGRRYFSLVALPHPDVADHLVWLVQNVTTEGRLDQHVMQQLNEVRLLRAQLESANQELVRLNDEKSAFLRMAAHDLRAPLAVIQGYVQWVREDTEALDEEAKDCLDVVLRRTQQMADLIDNLLDVEKIESGAVTLDREPVDMRDLVDEMGHAFQPVAQQAGLELQWRVPAGCPYPLADRARLMQVLNNLVSNALKFTPRGGLVVIDLQKRTADIVVEVSDSGPGISEEDQKRLFQRFFRTDASCQQRIPGTGLGLSIVKAIVQQHGGQVHCRSQLGEGTTFGFTLPLGGA